MYKSFHFSVARKIAWNIIVQWKGACYSQIIYSQVAETFIESYLISALKSGLQLCYQSENFFFILCNNGKAQLEESVSWCLSDILLEVLFFSINRLDVSVNNSFREGIGNRWMRWSLLKTYFLPTIEMGGEFYYFKPVLCIVVWQHIFSAIKEFHLFLESAKIFFMLVLEM